MVRPPFALIALFASLPVFAGDFYLSYHLVARDHAVAYEKLSISAAMTTFSGHFIEICRFPSPQTRFQTFAKNHRKDLLECLQKSAIWLRSYETYTNLLRQRDTVSLRIPPTRLKVDFNEGFVIIKRDLERGGD
ncbi:hypothetical protein [Hydrogenimonas sp.]